MNGACLENKAKRNHLCYIVLTVMDKNIGTPAILTDNCCNYKCFGIHMFISIVCIGTTQKSREEKPNLIYYHTELLKWTGKNDCHLFKIVRNNCISSM